MEGSVAKTAPADRQDRKLELAARAAWLYYTADNTQDEIAAKLNVSRQAAQRLVALAVSEKLIKFRLEHPIGVCMELAEALRARFDLDLCDVAPSDPAGDGTAIAGVAACAAGHLEGYLAQKAPLVLAFATGRTLRAAASQVSPMQRPQHKIVSLVGNLTRDGRASPYDVVIRLSDRVGAQCYPMPLPVVTDSTEECKVLRAQHSFATLQALIETAKVTFVGIGGIGPDCPMHADGFITDGELATLMDRGAVGETASWVFDAGGRLLVDVTNDRVTSSRPESPPSGLKIGVAGGSAKAQAILAALKGRLISGLITDEEAARAILAAN